MTLKSLLNLTVNFGDYFKWLKEWYPHRDEKFILNLHFEDMKKDLKSSVLAIAEFLQVTLTDEQVEKIVQDNTFSNRVKVQKSEADRFFLRKGKAGGWKDELTEEQVAKLDDWISKSLEGLEDVDLKL